MKYKPEDIKSMKYPENKPEQDGEYWWHDKYNDDWKTAKYDSEIEIVWEFDPDYFIPVRLDKENEMDVKVFMDWDNETGEVNITKPVTLEKGDFMAVVRRYLFEFGYQIIERLDYVRVPEKENEMDGKFVEFSVELRNLINKNSVENGCNTPDFILADFMIDCLHAFEYAVKGSIEWYGDNEVTREPEIKACPVCGGDNWLMEYERLDGYTMFCQDCFIGLHQYYPTEKECGEVWNALPRKGE